MLNECLDAATCEPGGVLAAAGRDGVDTIFMTLGHLAECNPFASYRPRAEDGGFVEPE